MENKSDILVQQIPEYLQCVDFSKLNNQEKYNLLRAFCKLELQDNVMQDLDPREIVCLVLSYCHFFFNIDSAKDE